MSDLPDAVSAYVSGVALGEHAIAWLRIARDGTVETAGGRLDCFGLAGAAGRAAELALDCLVGLLPADGPPVTLPSVEVTGGVHADVHVVESDEGSWVVLVDRSERVGERRFAQQLANDMSLLRNSLARKHGNETPWEDRFAVAQSGEQRTATTLVVALTGMAASDEPPSARVGAANRYHRAISVAVVDDAGVVTSSTGDRLMAVFGALPTTAEPAELGVRAAMRIVGAVDELNDARRDEGRSPFAFGVGVATGEMVLGALGGRASADLVALGEPADRASHLASLGRAIAIDAATFDALDDLRSRFRRADGSDSIYEYTR